MFFFKTLKFPNSLSLFQSHIVVIPQGAIDLDLR